MHKCELGIMSRNPYNVATRSLCAFCAMDLIIYARVHECIGLWTPCCRKRKRHDLYMCGHADDVSRQQACVSTHHDVLPEILRSQPGTWRGI